jgi:hypothetical protein
MMNKVLVGLLAVAAVWLRFVGHTEPLFKDAAHMFVAGLFVYGWRRRNRSDMLFKLPDGSNRWYFQERCRFFIWTAVLMTVGEVVCAFLYGSGILSK